MIPPGVGDAMINVNVSVAVLMILSVDEVKSSFYTKFTLSMEWMDPRLRKKLDG